MPAAGSKFWESLLISILRSERDAKAELRGVPGYHVVGEGCCVPGH